MGTWLSFAICGAGVSLGSSRRRRDFVPFLFVVPCKTSDVGPAVTPSASGCLRVGAYGTGAGLMLGATLTVAAVGHPRLVRPSVVAGSYSVSAPDASMERHISRKGVSCDSGCCCDGGCCGVVGRCLGPNVA